MVNTAVTFVSLTAWNLLISYYSHWTQCLISNSMVDSTLNANSFSANQNISWILWNPKANHRVYSSQAFALSWARLFNFTLFHPISLSYILISSHLRLCLSSGLLFKISHQRACAFFFPHTCQTKSQSTWFNHPYSVRWGVQKPWTCSLFIFLQPPVTSSSLDPDIFLASLLLLLIHRVSFP